MFLKADGRNRANLERTTILTVKKCPYSEFNIFCYPAYGVHQNTDPFRHALFRFPLHPPSCVRVIVCLFDVTNASKLTVTFRQRDAVTFRLPM